jgi:hypothetical protein
VKEVFPLQPARTTANDDKVLTDEQNVMLANMSFAIIPKVRTTRFISGQAD